MERFKRLRILRVLMGAICLAALGSPGSSTVSAETFIRFESQQGDCIGQGAQTTYTAVMVNDPISPVTGLP